MSGIAMEWAARQNLKGLAQLVLLRLCFHHNHETGRCDPSIATLAEGAGISPDKARRCLREIERAGLLSSSARKVGKVSSSNVYTLKMQASEKESGVLAISQGVPFNSQGGYPTAAGGVLAISQPNKEENREVEQEKGKTPQKPAERKAKVLRMSKAATLTDMPDLPDWIDSEAWAEWAEMRRVVKKKPLTKYSAKGAIADLERLVAQGNDANRLIRRATGKEWLSFIPDESTKADPPAKQEMVYEEISFGDAYAGHLPTGSEGR